MIKPDDIPQEIWDKARKTANMASAPYNTPELAHAIIARAILSASSQAYSRGLEDAAAACERLAAEQGEINLNYPDHVKAYPVWEEYPHKYRRCASEIRTLEK